MNVEEKKVWNAAQKIHRAVKEFAFIRGEHILTEADYNFICTSLVNAIEAVIFAREAQAREVLKKANKAARRMVSGVRKGPATKGARQAAVRVVKKIRKKTRAKN